MSGEIDIGQLFSTLTAELVDGIFVFTTVNELPSKQKFSPRMMFQEAEGITLVLLQSDAEELGVDYEFPCRMITLNVHSSLEAVGFISRISAALTQADMGVNPVSGFYHDHLFVPLGRETEALGILASLRAQANE
ncbi:MAG: ACT domain-containing protein [Roseobacter sp.]